jgi:hypothetical protein
VTEASRLVAWNDELSRAHARLRSALAVAREGLDADPPAIARDVLLYCHGFCLALDAHHRGEDASLFPELRMQHPELIPVIEKLEQDHSMIGYLLGALEDAVRGSADRPTLARHLEGIAAIMESHFRYEEREVLGVLATLDWDADPDGALGPL